MNFLEFHIKYLVIYKVKTDERTYISCNRNATTVLHHQKIVYKPASMPMIMTDPKIKAGETRKSFLSTTMV